MPLFLAGAVHASEPRASSNTIGRVETFGIVDRNCSLVWPVIADFVGIANWYSGFSKSRRASGRAGVVGEVRELTRASNNQILREELILMDPDNMILAYTHVLNSPVAETRSIVSLRPLSSRQCLVSWSNTFRPRPDQSIEQVAPFFTRAYGDVLRDLKTHVESSNPL